ncbi:MAG: hypothetical protein U0414_21645 [Polyangiaceae bacterium]
MALTFKPAQLEFGYQLVDTVSETKEVQVTNPDGASVDLRADGFTFEPSAVTKGTSTVKVTFRPTAPEPFTASVAGLTLTGTGARVSLTPSTVAFGNRPIGSKTSKDLVLRYEVPGASPATLEVSTPFSMAPQSISPSANEQTVKATFTPTAFGVWNARVDVVLPGGIKINGLKLDFSLSGQCDLDETITNTAPPRGLSIDSSDGPPQRLRLYVPTVKSEAVLGLSQEGHWGVRLRTEARVKRGDQKSTNTSTTVGLGINEKGFIGLLQHTDHGNVYIGAVGEADLGGTYRDTIIVADVVDSAVRLASAALTVGAQQSLADTGGTGGFATLTKAIQAIKLASAIGGFFFGTTSDGMGGAGDNYMSTGQTFVFGARSARVQGLESVSTSAGLFNTVAAGVSASVDSIVSSSLSAGAVASVYGGYSATLGGGRANIEARTECVISSQLDSVDVRGPTIRIGNASLKTTLVDDQRLATEDVWLRAAQMIEIGVPAQTVDGVHTDSEAPLKDHLEAPTGMQIVRGFGTRIAGTKASLTASDRVVATAGRTFLVVSRDRVNIGVNAKKGNLASAMANARSDYSSAIDNTIGLLKRAKAIVNDHSKKQLGVAALAMAAVTGVASGAGAGVGDMAAIKRRREEDPGGKASSTGPVAGVIVGGIAGAVTMGLVAMRMMGKRFREQKRAALNVYKRELSELLKNEQAEHDGTSVQGPYVDVTKEHAEIGFGPKGGPTIRVSKKGIEIEATNITIKGNLDVNGVEKVAL